MKRRGSCICNIEFIFAGTSLSVTLFRLRFPIGLWLLMLVVLQQGYLSLILALLTTPTHEPHIDSVGDLAEAIQTRGFKWMTYDNSYIYDCTFNNYQCSAADQFSQLRKVSITNKTILILGRVVKPGDNEEDVYDQIREGFKLIRSQSVVLAIVEAIARPIANKYKKHYYVSTSSYGHLIAARMYRIGSHLLKPTDK